MRLILAGAFFVMIPLAHAQPDPEFLPHLEQKQIVDLLRSGQKSAAFLASFESGDLFFEHVFKDSEGAGAYVGDGSRFTTIPRADLDGPGEWANHYPSRSTGPNARSCVACHDAPFSDGSGTNNEHRDPFHFGDPSRYIVRNTPHIFGLGGLQKLAEEMTDELHDQLDDVKDWSCTLGKTLKKKLSAKGISYGSIEVKPSWDSTGICDFKIDWSSLQGIDSDLVVKPFQWKGSVASIRDFNRGASHNELGIQAVELVGDSRDGDYDDIVDEATVGDMTALAVYAAAQQRPTSKQELSRLGLIPKLTRDEEASIHRGKDLFSQVGCASCHVPQLKLRDPIFSEPSRSPYYRDTVFPSGQKPMDRGVDPAAAVTFDLTRDQPSNQIKNEKGEVVYRLGSFEKDFWGRPVVELYSDLKRHDLGPEVAEAIDEAGTGASVFLTRTLWGVGSTAPYLHDGRAATLQEAVSFHGGEAAASRASFQALTEKERAQVVAFLNNLVLYKLPSDERSARRPAISR